jgi:type I restriction enzyme S subunit
MVKKKKTNIPELRFPGFEGEWEEKAIKDIAEINPPNQVIPNKFIYIDLESVIDGQLLKEDVLLKIEAPSRAQRVLKKRDVLFQLVRPYQMNNYYFDKNGDYIASTGYAQIRAQQNALYLYHYLHFQKFVDKVLERCTGTSYPAINSSDFSKINVNLPTLPEQEKLASFLSVVDERIQQLSKKKSLLEQYKKGVMQQIFSQKLRFKDDNGDLYHTWEEKKLGDIADIKTGNKDLADRVENGKFPFFVRSSNIERIDSFSFDGEAILIPGDGKIGEIFHYIDGKFDYHQRVYKISCNGRAINIKFLYHYLTLFFYKHAMNYTVKATVDSLRLPIIQSFCVNLPSLPEQKRIASFLTSIDKKIKLVNTQLEKTKAWKKGLLQKMFV